MQSTAYKNQSGIISPAEIAGKSFCIVGAGAIGSYLVGTLAKMGAKDITVFDFDTVEEHNVANQMYGPLQTGKKKVDALKELVFEGSEVEIFAAGGKFLVNEIGADFIVSCVDNMATRKEIFQSIADGFMPCKYLVDGRMGAQFMRTYCIDASNKNALDFYAKTLYDDAQALQDRCTEKSIIYTGLIVAGLMLNMIKRAVNNEPGPIEEVFDCVTSTHVATRI